MSTPTAPIAPPETEEQTPVPETEETPNIDIGESDSEETEEQAEPQGEDEGKPPDPISVLQQTIDRLSGQIEELKSRPTTDPQTIEANVRERTRMESEQREREQQQAASDREEVEEAINATLIAGGVPQDMLDAQAVRKATERVFNKRYDQIANKEIGHVSEALRWVRGFAETGTAPHAISGRASQYAGQFADDFNAIFGKLKSQAQQTADFSQMKADDLMKRLSADQIKAIADAEIGKRNAQNRNGTKPLRRPEGAPPTVSTNTIEYWDARIAHQGEDGYPHLTDSDWATARKVRAEHGL